MPKLKRSRINFSIKTDFQLRILFKIVGIILLGTIATSGVFYYYANEEIGNSFRHFHITARNFLDYLFPAVLISGLVGFIVATIISFFFPHTFGGPLYRIERDLTEKIGEGDLTVRYHLRKGDALKDLADSLNNMLEKIGGKIKEIEAASGDLSHLISANDNPALKKVREAHKKLTDKIGRFKTPH